MGTTTNTISGSSPITVNLTDVMGERTVTVRAEVKINGYTFTQDQTVFFGKGPLSVFAGQPRGSMKWRVAVDTCGGGTSSPNFPSEEQLQVYLVLTGASFAYLAAG